MMSARLYSGATTDLAQRTRWYAFVRFFFLLALALPSLISLYVFQRLSGEVKKDLMLLAAALVSNVIFYLLIRVRTTPRYQKAIGTIWIVLDMLMVTVLIFTNGGIESRSPILYVMPILMAAAIYGRRATYYAALSSGVLYIGVILGDYFGAVHSSGAFHPELRSDLPYVVTSICFIPAILLVIARAVDLITKLFIEQQQRAEKHLQELTRAQDIARLGSWEWDVAHDKITWSDGLIKLFGFADRPESLNYETYLTMIHPDDAARHRKIIGNALKKQQAFRVNHRIVMADGSIKYMYGEGRPFVDSNGRVVKFTGTSQDVSEMNEFDNVKREFVSLASHQLRTPASGVKSFLSLILDGYAGDITKKQRQFIQRAYDANDRQLDIIDNLLSLAAIESGKLQLHKTSLDVIDVARSCLLHHRPTIKLRQQKLVTRFPRSPIRVYGDRSHLLMALDNLISNAIKYSPDKGHITVTITRQKSSVYIEVADTGIGIARKDISALFQKFSRLNDASSLSVNGSGLGLYLARYIVRLHKGSLTVRSHHGEGSQFRIRLPALMQKAVK